MTIDLTNIELNGDMLMIANEDGSMKCIPREDCNANEQAIFNAFNEAYPNGKPITVDINLLKQQKVDEISRTCGQVIVSGFYSTAHEGVERLYKTTMEDQSNITGNALSAMSKLAGTPGYEDEKLYYHADGEPFTEWQPSECTALARDFKIFKELQLFRSNILQGYILTLDDAELINSINWDTPLPS
jgi:hypothetical protein